jgi:hypothetical protein
MLEGSSALRFHTDVIGVEDELLLLVGLQRQMQRQKLGDGSLLGICLGSIYEIGILMRSVQLQSLTL